MSYVHNRLLFSPITVTPVKSIEVKLAAPEWNSLESLNAFLFIFVSLPLNVTVVKFSKLWN